MGTQTQCVFLCKNIAVLCICFVFLLTPFRSWANNQGPSQTNSIESLDVLKVPDQRAIQNAFAQKLLPIEKFWQQLESQSQSYFICLGEIHNEEYRSFYTENVFKKNRFDRIFLEESPENLAEIQASFSGPSPEGLLGAPIKELIKTAETQNPSLQLKGVEPDASQKQKLRLDALQPGPQKDRDSYIALNIYESLKAAHRHNFRSVALYGASHCGNLNLGLGTSIPFHIHLKNLSPDVKIMNMRWVTLRDHPKLIYFLQSRGIQINEVAVLKNAHEMPGEFFYYDAEIASLFSRFDHLILAPLPRSD